MTSFCNRDSNRPDHVECRYNEDSEESPPGWLMNCRTHTQLTGTAGTVSTAGREGYPSHRAKALKQIRITGRNVISAKRGVPVGGPRSWGREALEIHLSVSRRPQGARRLLLAPGPRTCQSSSGAHYLARMSPSVSLSTFLSVISLFICV